MYYEKFQKLCDIKGVKASEVSRQTGVATATLSSWKKGKYTPGTDKLQKIADYFEVPLSYLTSDVEKSQQLPEYYINHETAEIAQELFENKELHALFSVGRDMDPEDLRALHNMALALKRKERYNGDDPA